MVRGTTPVLTFSIPFMQETIEALYITFVQAGETVLEKDINSIEFYDGGIMVHLTQENTLAFDEALPLEIQIRLKTNYGSAYASNIIRTSIDRILKDGTI